MMHNATPQAAAARKHKREVAGALGIDERFVSDLVDRFYSRVRDDPRLGPIFATHIADWPPHLEQMKRFWRSILFSSGEFVGSPMAKHIAISELDRDLFVRWLELFSKTLAELGSPAAAEHVHGKARTIATSLLNGISIHRDGGMGLRTEEAFRTTRKEDIDDVPGMR